MEITWLGHSSFIIRDSKGRTLLTDPFDESVGYRVYHGDADVITVSHHHFDHDYTEAVGGNPEIISKVGMFYAHDIPIKGIHSFHDKDNGLKRGENTIYVFEMDGFRLCHLGDIGHMLSEKQLKEIGAVDVLFIPVGGNFTIDGKEASKVAESIGSHIIIPMHYKTPAVSLPIEGIEIFLKNMKNCENVGSSTIKIEEKLTSENLVKILDYKN